MKLHSNIRTLTWFNFFTDFQLYAPIAILYFTQVTGSFALGMSIFSIMMISSAIFEIPTGVLSDRIGRRKTVIFGALAAVIYSLCYAIGQSYWVLIVGALFAGLSRSLYSGNNDALLHDTLAETHNEEDYGKYLGKVSTMFQVALASSALLGSILATWSFSLIMWLSIIPQIVCLYLAFQVKEPQVHSRRSGNIYQHLAEAYRNFFDNRKLRLLSLSSVLGYGFGEASYQFQSAFYATVWPVWAVGLAKTFSNVLSAFSYHFSGQIIKRFGGLNILIAANIYDRAVTIIGTAIPSVVSPILLASGSMFHGVGSVATNSLLQKEFTHNQRATMGSLNSFAGSLFFGILAILLGFVADKLAPAKALLFLQLFQLINLWVFWKLFHHRKDK